MNARTGLIVCLGVIAALLGYTGYLHQQSAGHSQSAPSWQGESEPSAPANRSSQERDWRASLRSALAFDWETVASDDLREYIQHLRTIGCPEQTIEDIIVGEVDRRFERRSEAVLASATEFAFWETGRSLWELVDEEVVDRLRKLEQEKEALLTDLLGEKGPGARGSPHLAERSALKAALAFLSPSKRAKVLAVERELAAARQKTAVTPGVLSQAQRQHLRRLRQQKDAALEAILSQEEKWAYDLRLSSTANALRQELAGFQPTPEEFEQILRWRKELIDEFGETIPWDSEERQARREAQETMEQNIRKLLGEERYSRYRQAREPGYRIMVEVAEQHGLPLSAAEEAYEIHRIAQEEAARLLSNPEIPEERKEEALVEIEAETEQALTDVLGEEGLETYTGIDPDWSERLGEPAGRNGGPLPGFTP